MNQNSSSDLTARTPCLECGQTAPAHTRDDIGTCEQFKRWCLCADPENCVEVPLETSYRCQRQVWPSAGGRV